MANEIRERDEVTGVTLLWNGGHTIHVLGAGGQEIDTRSVFVSTNNDEDPANVKASMRRILAELRQG